MIVRFARTLDPRSFTKKYPKPHVVVGHFDPTFVKDEEATGEPSLFAVLSTAKNTLNLVGECTGKIDSATTMRFMFALGEDAARFCALVRATPNKTYGDCATMAFFKYDQRLYGELLGIRNKRLGEIRTAYDRGEPVDHAYGTDDPLPLFSQDEDAATADDIGLGGSMRVLARPPLGPR